jgi:glutamate-ammonia-ligase adenylyltransferase
MLDAHPNPTALFDIKHDRGGIIDVEFIVQYLVLGYAHVYPQLTGNIGNIALLKLAGDLGLIPAKSAEQVRTAYREFRRLQHRLRLSGDPELAGSAASPEKSAGFARIEADYLSHARLAVLQLWEEVFGG